MGVFINSSKQYFMNEQHFYQHFSRDFPVYSVAYFKQIRIPFHFASS